MHIYTYMNICTYIHIYIHMYICTYIHTYIHMYIYMYIHIYMLEFAYIYVCTYVHTYVQHTHTYTYTYTHTQEYLEELGLAKLERESDYNIVICGDRGRQQHLALDRRRVIPPQLM
jgi:hypothetical protein